MIDIYEHHNYKTAIRAATKNHPSMSLKRLSQSVPMQYTYLSKVLGDNGSHLSEDQLFVIGETLDLSPAEREYLLLLRAQATCHNPGRREYLQQRFEHIQDLRKLRAKVKEADASYLKHEQLYLLDPYCIVIHVALHIESFAKTPTKLCALLGLSYSAIQTKLAKLRDAGVIELDESARVIKVHQNHIHYSPNHPLMRTHQQLLGTLSANQIQKNDETDKYRFMASFSADPDALKQIRHEFERFLERVEQVALSSPDRHAYQLNFDLFKWV